MQSDAQISLVKPSSLDASGTKIALEQLAKAKISILIPIYNEEQNIPLLFEHLFDVLDRLSCNFEVVAVNDGSRDGSLAKLREAAAKRHELKVLDFCGNYGQTAAIMAAIDYASGDILISMDADLQNDPEDIPRLIERMNDGYDVVSGWRQDRQDAAIQRNFVSRIANRLISSVSGVRLHDYGCTLKAYRSGVVKGVKLYGEMHRFVPIYASWMGAKITEIPVQHHARKFGKSNYGLERTVKVVLDLIVVMFLHRYFTKPIYIFGGFGVLSFVLSAVSFVSMLYLKLVDGISLILTPLPLLTALTFLVGFISVLLGLLAEILVRIYFESQGRAAYLVREQLNVTDNT
jgi:glycosyltransferase involved in cell wall biosynthesis